MKFYHFSHFFLIFLIIIIIFILIFYIKYLNYIQTLGNSIKDQNINHKNIYIIQNFLPKKIFLYIKNSIIQFKKKNNSKRNSSYDIYRKGSAIDYHTLLSGELKPIIQLLTSTDILYQIKKKTNLNIQFVPALDTNKISLIFYENEGDYIKWHQDSNQYIGNRWAGIYTMYNRNQNNDSLSSSLFKYKVDNKIYSIKNPENSLILFQGDKILHQVTPLKKGEKRFVFSFVFCDICQSKLNLINNLKQQFINYHYYGM